VVGERLNTDLRGWRGFKNGQGQGQGQGVKARTTATAKATANTGVLRFAQNDGVKLATATATATTTKATAKARATARACGIEGYLPTLRGEALRRMGHPSGLGGDGSAVALCAMPTLYVAS
jgi:hypothetical protein